MYGVFSTLLPTRRMDAFNLTDGKAQATYGASLPVFLTNLTTAGIVFGLSIVVAALVGGRWRWTSV